MSSEKSCRECKDWKRCLLTESERNHFSYQDIRFCPQQIFWLLRYENIIRGHAWPQPDVAVPGGVGGVALPEAAFTKVSLVLAEIYARLKGAGIRGELLASQCKEPERGKMEYLDDKMKEVLWYVAGDSRKRTSFSAWLARRRSYRRAVTRDMTKSVT